MEYIVNDKIRFIYSEESSIYMEEIINHFMENYISIMQFFDKKDLDKPLIITFWDDKTKFREELRKFNYEELPEWTVGIAISDKSNPVSRVESLSLEATRTIPLHKDNTVEDLKKRIIHETVHVIHDEFLNYAYDTVPTWASEGVATFLSGQYENPNLTVPLDKIKKDDEVVPYQNYRYIFNKMSELFSKDEILDILRGKNTDRVFEVIEQNNKNITVNK